MAFHRRSLMVHSRAAFAAPTGGGGPAFPTLTGIFARYKANDAGTTVVGGFVTGVSNLVTPGTNNLVANGSVPYNATSAYNSKPAFDFTATSGAVCLYTASFGVSTPLSVFVVGRMNSTTPDYGAAASYGVGIGSDYSSSGSAVLLGRNGSGDQLLFASAAAGLVGTTMSSNANHRFGVILDPDVGTPTNKQYIDGSLANTNATLTPITTNGTLVIGNRYSTGAVGSTPWVGPILEVVVCTSILSGPEIGLLDAYFTGTYGS